MPHESLPAIRLITVEDAIVSDGKIFGMPCVWPTRILEKAVRVAHHLFLHRSNVRNWNATQPLTQIQSPPKRRNNSRHNNMRHKHRPLRAIPRNIPKIKRSANQPREQEEHTGGLALTLVCKDDEGQAEEHIARGPDGEVSCMCWRRHREAELLCDCDL